MAEPTKQETEQVFKVLKAQKGNKIAPAFIGTWVCISLSCDSWQLAQLRTMKVGRNASATEFFTKHGGSSLLTDSDTKKKYSSCVAELYKEELARRVKEGAANSTSRAIADDAPTTAREKFGTQKAISSDMYFGRGSYDPTAQAEAQTRLRDFQGATAISSNAYFWREEEEEMLHAGGEGGEGLPGLNSAARDALARVLANPDVQSAGENIRNGALKRGCSCPITWLLYLSAELCSVMSYYAKRELGSKYEVFPSPMFGAIRGAVVAYGAPKTHYQLDTSSDMYVGRRTYQQHLGWDCKLKDYDSGGLAVTTAIASASISSSIGSRAVTDDAPT
ncbi:hypothetical protein BDQ17DRAFT_1511871 [Cyathus striatus]|nr:hypothetical protein BDQ17DRAFT_1511871 [Cyathus striatus]